MSFEMALLRLVALVTTRVILHEVDETRSGEVTPVASSFLTICPPLGDTVAWDTHSHRRPRWIAGKGSNHSDQGHECVQTQLAGELHKRLHELGVL